jgi:hypothetical protein
VLIPGPSIVSYTSPAGGEGEALRHLNNIVGSAEAI